MNENQERLLQVRAVALLVGMGKSTIWRKAKSGDFPKPVQVSAGITRWKLSEVNEWLVNPAQWVAK